MGAGAAAVDDDEVVVLGPRLVEAAGDGVRVAHILAAGDGDQGAARQVRPGLARMKSRASMAAEVSAPVCERWLPCRGRQTSRVSAR